MYFGSFDGYLYAVDAATGSQRWRFQTLSTSVSNGGTYIDESDGTSRGAIVASPAVAGGMVYFGDGAGYFYALDAITGTQRWSRRTTSGGIGSPPEVADGVAAPPEPAQSGQRAPE